MNLMLEAFDDLENKIIILGGDFNLFLDPVIEAEGGNPVLNTSSVSKLIEIKEKYNLCDIWGGSEFSSYEIESRKMTSHFELLTENF